MTPTQAKEALQKIEDEEARENADALLKAGRVDPLKYEPLPKQEEFHRNDNKIRFLLGGNGSGKTRGGAQECYWQLTKNHPYNPSIRMRPGPVHGWVVVTDHQQQKQSGASQDKMLSLIPPELIKKHRWEKGVLMQILMVDGSTLEWKSAVAGRETIQGARVDFIWGDEDCVPNEDYWNELVTRSPEVRATGNELFRLHFFLTYTAGLKENKKVSFLEEELLPKANKPGSDIRLWEMSIYENIHMSQQNKDDVVNHLVGDEAKINSRIHGTGWRKPKNLVYEFNTKIHQIRPIPQHRVKKEFIQVYRVIDPHPEKPIAVSFFGVTADFNFVQWDELFEDLLVEQVAKRMKAKCSGLGHLVKKTIIDYSANAKDRITGRSVTEEFKKFGIHCVNCRKDVHSGIESVKKLMYYDIEQDIAPRFRVTANCTNTIKEFRGYRWNLDAGKPFKRSDEHMDNLRYFASDYDVMGLIEGKTRKTKNIIEIDEQASIISQNRIKAAKLRRRMELLGEGIGSQRQNFSKLSRATY